MKLQRNAQFPKLSLPSLPSRFHAIDFIKFPGNIRVWWNLAYKQALGESGKMLYF